MTGFSVRGKHILVPPTICLSTTYFWVKPRPFQVQIHTQKLKVVLQTRCKTTYFSHFHRFGIKKSSLTLWEKTLSDFLLLVRRADSEY